MLLSRTIAALAFLTACNGSADKGVSATDSGGEAVVEDEPDCAEAEALLGYPACTHRVATEDTFEAFTVTSASVDQMRVGKYLVPAVEDARLPPVFINVSEFPLHFEFLVTAFPDRFSGLSTSDYEQLTLHSDTREFYAGTVSLYIDSAGFFYGFTVWDDPGSDDDVLTLEQATAAWSGLQDRFDVGTLAWVPTTEGQLAAAESWTDAPFEIKGLEPVEYEAYNPGEAFGTLRLYTLEELEEAYVEGSFGYQDIVVLDEAPSDLERVVSGIVTGTRQGGLSHLNVRSLARGTPNCFVKGPFEAVAEYADKLVRFECGETDWSVRDASEEEAQAWWDSIRPEPVEICDAEREDDSILGLMEVPTDSKAERSEAICRYGAKGANLATLYQRIDDRYQFDGFVIPFHYYDAFVQQSTWTVDLGDGVGTHSFAETLDAWHADEAFLSDPSVRRERLAALRDAFFEAPIDPELIEALSERIVDTWGDDTTMVRFRSSSNAEDGLDFSGAGLYTSESACVADELDGDADGPCICDPDKGGERSISDALHTVWASLWNMQAWDERDWYGIPYEQIAMGILVNDRSKDEQANAVAFTGNPTSEGDNRYLINAQEGEVEVVSSEPGVFPESILVTVDDGEVTNILRVTQSSEVSEVLTDAEVEELAGVLSVCAEAFPNDYTVPDGHDLLWDTEWKITSEGRLVVKQIRPYLR